MQSAFEAGFVNMIKGGVRRVIFANGVARFLIFMASGAGDII
jgi:hypothetical protein